ncbi:MAG TPA: histidine phosphatase family protein [candidate division Zixibacteria bacterium]|nr:histidine phosphatase family protein [candidate division Zixibacteria bacterium]
MQIVLLRHAATDWNLEGRCQGSSDLELNATGIGQARAVAELLAGERIHAVYSSRLKRARQTAELVSRPHGLGVAVEEDLHELDHGQLEGLTFDDVKIRYSEFLERWRTEPAEIRVPGGEKLVEVAERAWNGLNRIVLRHRDEETLVVVSHHFPILGIVCRITGTDLNRYRTFRLEPCSLTRLNLSPARRWSITEMNGVPCAPGTPAQPLEG